MPTVLRVGPYEFYFYSHDGTEPAHVHVDREIKSAKLWLQPIAVARNLGFRSVELRKILRIVEENQEFLLTSWHEHFGS